MYLFALMIVFLLIPTVMITLNLVLSKKMTLNQEKASPFECGFDPSSFNRQPFSIQFFLITLIFLIFDIEIALLIPLVPLGSPPPTPSMIMALFFLMILIIGLYFEYMDKSIDWKT